MNSSNMSDTKWVVRPLVPEEVYTDREEFLEYFYNAALCAGTRRTMSTVLLGQRRMGKTEIFKRVVNRLFFSQNPRHPEAVVPVYFCFPDGPIDTHSFAVMYFENFMRYYTAFYTSEPEIIRGNCETGTLISLMKKFRSDFPSEKTLDLIFQKHEAICKGETILPHFTALETPRRISDIDETTIVMFLDEFQNTRLPQYGFDIAGFMQQAVESPTCPHFVTGSAMSIIGREIIGRGSLFGRFDSEEITPLTDYWGKELALKSARYSRTEIPETMAPVVAQRCGGNPFYINAVVRQSAKIRTVISDEETLNKIMAVDISSGFIWGELSDQVNRWIERINGYGITKWVLYLSALEENENKERRNELNLEKIRQTILDKEGKDVPVSQIRDVLIRLSRGDLVEFLEMGNWFRRVKDPILREFLKVWGRIEVEGKKQTGVRDRLVIEYGKLKRRFSEYKGYLAEIHMSQVLLNGQRRTVAGKYFSSSEDIQMPDMFFYIRRRMRLEAGKNREIDVLAAAGTEQWVCQSKWVKEKTGIAVLKDLKDQADTVMQAKEPLRVRMWIFAHEGLTDEALAYAKEQGILWSDRKQLDELLVHLGLRPLPDV
ncbi:MAG: hypothetical protein V2I97_10760 [Desulfococcaceae bacterium]|jgi:hypothetical protein|nr:hypothetical protein [Desulfococcaceae bacterium]